MAKNLKIPKKGLKTFVNKLDKSLDKTARVRKLVRPSKRVTIVENQPVYDKDKSRFFKETWNEERRQLFFK